MFRIRMNLENPNVQLRQNINAMNRSNMAPNPAAVNRSVALNASMIDRVHKTRPGCSACGKKVA